MGIDFSEKKPSSRPACKIINSALKATTRTAGRKRWRWCQRARGEWIMADLHYFRPDWAPARTEIILPWRASRPVSMLRRALGGTGMLPRLDLVRAGMSRRRQRRNE